MFRLTNKQSTYIVVFFIDLLLLLKLITARVCTYECERDRERGRATERETEAERESVIESHTAYGSRVFSRRASTKRRL